jgi:hypothetical protein
MSYLTLGYIAVMSYALPIPVGLAKFKLLSREQRIVFILLAIGLITDLLSIWQYFGPRSTPWLGHLYILVEFVLVMSVIFSWQDEKRSKRVFQTVLLVYVAFWILAKFLFEPINGLYYLTGSISNVFLTLSAGYTMFVVVEGKISPLLSNPRFWILLAFILYYGGSLLPITLSSIVFHHSKEDLYRLWSITWICTIGSHFLFAKGFMCRQTQI